MASKLCKRLTSLRKKVSMISEFDGQYRFLSNFFMQDFEYEGRVWKSVEHAFQAYKFYPDVARMEEVANCATPGKAKRMGRLPGIRADWNQVRVQVMTDLVRIKFSVPYLRERLLETGDEELIEGNSWGDTFWGMCQGVGENHLGRILMQIRAEIREEVTNDWID